jgi:hypothetical protein
LKIKLLLIPQQAFDTGQHLKTILDLYSILLLLLDARMLVPLHIHRARAARRIELLTTLIQGQHGVVALADAGARGCRPLLFTVVFQQSLPLVRFVQIVLVASLATVLKTKRNGLV